MLYLFNQGKEKTRAEIIHDLKRHYTDQEVEEKLNAFTVGDLISQGSTAYIGPDEKLRTLINIGSAE